MASALPDRELAGADDGDVTPTPSRCVEPRYRLRSPGEVGAAEAAEEARYQAYCSGAVFLPGKISLSVARVSA